MCKCEQNTLIIETSLIRDPPPFSSMEFPRLLRFRGTGRLYLTDGVSCWHAMPSGKLVLVAGSCNCPGETRAECFEPFLLDHAVHDLPKLAAHVVDLMPRDIGWIFHVENQD